jgi:hypothetical protein
MLLCNYYFIPNSKGFVFASDKRYLIGDGILTKCWEKMAFIDENTAFSKKRQVIDQEMHKRASVIIKDNIGNKIESGYKSEIIGYTIKDNPDKVRGIVGELIFFEECGVMPELKLAYESARAAVEQDTYVVGNCFMWGTASPNEGNFADLRDLFTNPDGNNILSVPNIWDEGAHNTKCGFFHPSYEGLEGYDEDGNRRFMDNDGNTYVEKAKAYLVEERRKMMLKATSQFQIDAWTIERCTCPAEAMLSLSGNIFPIRELQQQLTTIRNDTKLQNFKQVGDLIFAKDNTVTWQQRKFGDIKHYKLKPEDDQRGAIVIWEHPVPHAPFGLYIAANDPYDHDAAGNPSLGSTFIYKRFNSIEGYNDMIVAEYTGRPDSADEYYENVRKLLLYYNARCLVENQNKGIITYFYNKKCDYLLIDQPDILQDILHNTKVRRGKGVHMPVKLKDVATIWLRDWLNEEYAPGKKNILKIFSEPLLEELIQFNNKGNFDRYSAMIILMILLKEYERIVVKALEQSERKQIFDQPLFTDTYFGQSNSDVGIFDMLEKRIPKEGTLII